MAMHIPSASIPDNASSRQTYLLWAEVELANIEIALSTYASISNKRFWKISGAAPASRGVCECVIPFTLVS